MAAKVKVWRVRPEAPAHFEVHEGAAFMAANKKNFIAVDEAGTTIKGPCAIAAMGESQRTGGLWVKMPEWLGMFPSTIASPFPSVIVVPPLGFVKNIVAGVAFATAFLVA